MELEGSLTAFSLPEVIQFLGQGKMTGSLTLHRGEAEVRLDIREGRIINSSTMDRIHKVGEMLVHREVIPRSVLDQTLEYQSLEAPDQKIGELLIAKGHITVEQLENTIQLQFEEDIWDLFGWREGAFKFEHKEPDAQGAAIVEIEIEPLLLEGSRRWDEWERIIKNVPDENVVFRVVSPSRRSVKQLEFAPREWAVLSMLNGKYTVGSIVARSGYGTFETFSVLNSLLEKGVVAIKTGLEMSQAAQALAAGTSVKSETASQNGGHGENGVNGSRGGLLSVGGLLGRRRSAEDGAVDAARVETQNGAVHASPVGMAAAYINKLTETLLANADFNLGERDRLLLSELWRPIINDCPKADLIRMRGVKVDASNFESFVTLTRDEETLRSCYEDSIEALCRLLKSLYAVAAQRLGDRESETLFSDALESGGNADNFALFRPFEMEPFLSKAIAE